MRIGINTPQQLQGYINKIDNHVKANHKLEWTKYVTLGSKTVRLLGYSKEFLRHIERQLTYVLKNDADSFDATIVLWNETKGGVKSIHEKILAELPKHRIRLEMILSKGKGLAHSAIYNISNSKTAPSIDINPLTGFINVYESEDHTYYYGVEDLSTEGFIKEGHVLVQFFNKITKTDNTALVHGALVGLENEGVLFCARGQRGKSTLSVLSMMDGFDYVSDDYLVLEKDGDKLYTDPIYSIITLSPRMYDELYGKLDGSRFISNNGRKDKYVLNIANYHNQFKSKYPVKFCMFPEIVSDAEPSIVPCPKGRAICQVVQSTVVQLQDNNHYDVINKIKNMVKDYEFYQINLCQDIQKNTDCLREFMNNYDNREAVEFTEDRMYEDMVFDVTHILDSETNIIYHLNQFATLIYKNLKEGVDKDAILNELKAIKEIPLDIEESFNLFIRALLDKNILKELKSESFKVNIDKNLIEMFDRRILFREFLETGTKDLVAEYKTKYKKDK